MKENSAAMCCRYYLAPDPDLVEAINRSTLADRIRDKLGRPLTTAGEIHPTDIVPTFAPSRAGSTSVFPMVWGFSGRTVLFNAREETASQKPTFKEAWQAHRCAVPASWYYEWRHLTAPDGKKKTGGKMLIQPQGCERFYLAGLYRTEEAAGIKFPTFTILTTAPSPSVIDIHDRMPLILPTAALEQWIALKGRPEEVIRLALAEMVVEPAPPEQPKVYA